MPVAVSVPEVTRAQMPGSPMKLEDRLGSIWLFLSALWVEGYLHAEALDGMMFQELGEVIPMTLLPPLLPPLILAWAVRVFAGLSRP